MAHHGQETLDKASLFIQQHTPGFIKQATQWFGESDQRAAERLKARGFSQESISKANKELNPGPDATDKFLQKITDVTNVDPRIVRTTVGALTSAAQGKAGISQLKTGLTNWARQLKAKPVQALTPKVKPTKAVRDAMVDSNTMPNRADMRPADFRGVSGDVQAGVKGNAIRMESRPDYKVANTAVPNPNSKTPRPVTPHHRMGIQDNRAFFAGKTGPQASKRRKELAAAGLFPGNQAANYESLFDGVKSAKSAKRTGIRSYDHDDVHRLSDARRSELGIKFNKKNRDLDTWNDIPIKDLPEPVQRALQIQLGWEDELIIDKVQGARGKAFRQKFGHLSYEERKKIILNHPEQFANLSTRE